MGLTLRFSVPLHLTVLLFRSQPQLSIQGAWGSALILNSPQGATGSSQSWAHATEHISETPVAFSTEVEKSSPAVPTVVETSLATAAVDDGLLWQAQPENSDAVGSAVNFGSGRGSIEKFYFAGPLSQLRSCTDSRRTTGENAASETAHRVAHGDFTGTDPSAARAVRAVSPVLRPATRTVGRRLSSAGSGTRTSSKRTSVSSQPCADASPQCSPGTLRWSAGGAVPAAYALPSAAVLQSSAAAFDPLRLNVTRASASSNTRAALGTTAPPHSASLPLRHAALLNTPATKPTPAALAQLSQQKAPFFSGESTRYTGGFTRPRSSPPVVATFPSQQRWPAYQLRGGLPAEVQQPPAKHAPANGEGLTVHQNNLAQPGNTENKSFTASPYKAIPRVHGPQHPTSNRLSAAAGAPAAGFPDRAPGPPSSYSPSLSPGSTVPANTGRQSVGRPGLPTEKSLGDLPLPLSTALGSPVLAGEATVSGPHSQGVALAIQQERLRLQHHQNALRPQERHVAQHHVQQHHMQRLPSAWWQNELVQQQQQKSTSGGKSQDLLDAESPQDWLLARQQLLGEQTRQEEHQRLRHQLRQQQEQARALQAQWNIDLLRLQKRQHQLEGVPRVHPVHTPHGTVHLNDEIGQEAVLAGAAPLSAGLPAVSIGGEFFIPQYQQAYPLFRADSSGVRGGPRSDRWRHSYPSAGEVPPAHKADAFPASAQYAHAVLRADDAVAENYEFQYRHPDAAAAFSAADQRAPEVQHNLPLRKGEKGHRTWLFLHPHDLEHLPVLLSPVSALSAAAGKAPRTKVVTADGRDIGFSDPLTGGRQTARPAAEVRGHGVWFPITGRQAGAESVKYAKTATPTGEASARQTEGYGEDFPPLKRLVKEVDLTQYGEDPAYDYVAYMNQQVCRGLFYNPRQNADQDNAQDAEEDTATGDGGKCYAPDARRDSTTSPGVYASRQPSTLRTYLKKLQNLSMLFHLKSLLKAPQRAEKSLLLKRPMNQRCLLDYYLTSFEESLQTCIPKVSPAMWAERSDLSPQQLLRYHKSICRVNAPSTNSFDLSVQPAGNLYRAFSALTKYVGGGRQGGQEPEESGAMAAAAEADKHEIADGNDHATAASSSPGLVTDTIKLQRGGKKGEQLIGAERRGGARRPTSIEWDATNAAGPVGRAVAKASMHSYGRARSMTEGTAAAGGSGRRKAAVIGQGEKDSPAAKRRVTQEVSPEARETAAQWAGAVEGAETLGPAEQKGSQAPVRSFAGPMSFFQTVLRVFRSPVAAFLLGFLQRVSQEVRRQQREPKAVNVGTALTSAIESDRRLQHVETIQTATLLPLICTSYVRYSDLYAEGYAERPPHIGKWAEHPVLQFLYENKEEAELFIPTDIPLHIQVDFDKALRGTEDERHLALYELWHTLWFMVTELSRADHFWTWSRNRKANQVLPWWNVVTVGLHKPLLRRPVRYGNGVWRFKNIDPTTYRLRCGKPAACRSRADASPAAAAAEGACDFIPSPAAFPRSFDSDSHPASSLGEAGAAAAGAASEESTAAGCNPFEMRPPPSVSESPRRRWGTKSSSASGAWSLFHDILSAGLRQDNRNQGDAPDSAVEEGTSSPFAQDGPPEDCHSFPSQQKKTVHFTYKNRRLTIHPDKCGKDATFDYVEEVPYAMLLIPHDLATRDGRPHQRRQWHYQEKQRQQQQPYHWGDSGHTRVRTIPGDIADALWIFSPTSHAKLWLANRNLSPLEEEPLLSTAPGAVMHRGYRMIFRTSYAALMESFRAALLGENDTPDWQRETAGVGAEAAWHAEGLGEKKRGTSLPADFFSHFSEFGAERADDEAADEERDRQRRQRTQPLQETQQQQRYMAYQRNALAAAFRSRSSTRPFTVVLAGHSQGGVGAQICALYLAKLMRSSVRDGTLRLYVVTFGAPPWASRRMYEEIRENGVLLHELAASVDPVPTALSHDLLTGLTSKRSIISLPLEEFQEIEFSTPFCFSGKAWKQARANSNPVTRLLGRALGIDALLSVPINPIIAHHHAYGALLGVLSGRYKHLGWGSFLAAPEAVKIFSAGALVPEALEALMTAHERMVATGCNDSPRWFSMQW